MEEKGMILAQKKGECVRVVPGLCHVLCQCFVSVLCFVFLVSYLGGNFGTRKKKESLHVRARIKKGYIGAVSGEHVLNVIKGSVWYT